MASTHLEDADPHLAERFTLAKAVYEAANPGHAVQVTCTYRSVAEQQALYTHGRTTPGPVVTQCDGVTNPSKHNTYPSRAIDFAIVIYGKITWANADYVGMGQAAEAQGLGWGGAWTHGFLDFPHVELKE